MTVTAKDRLSTANHLNFKTIMKPIILLFTLMLCFSISSSAQKEKDSIENAITRFFDGISEINPGVLRDYSTSDFLLLENGEVWTVDTLINKLSTRRNSNLVRINKFRFIKTEQDGNIAWVSYHNTAEFRLNDKQQTVRWLESAVLVKDKTRWKIKLMHSTRLRN